MTQPCQNQVPAMWGARKSGSSATEGVNRGSGHVPDLAAGLRGRTQQFGSVTGQGIG